mmetsp:Transcript_62375/g.139294  ORF Transcript_62375/g.139294 Transcript_62375/m.139294 type:complete len:280 (+) Transcript_62375:117-956(+)
MSPKQSHQRREHSVNMCTDCTLHKGSKLLAHVSAVNARSTVETNPVVGPTVRQHRPVSPTRESWRELVFATLHIRGPFGPRPRGLYPDHSHGGEAAEEAGDQQPIPRPRGGEKGRDGVGQEAQGLVHGAGLRQLRGVHPNEEQGACDEGNMPTQAHQRQADVEGPGFYAEYPKDKAEGHDTDASEHARARAQALDVGPRCKAWGKHAEHMHHSAAADEPGSMFQTQQRPHRQRQSSRRTDHGKLNQELTHDCYHDLRAAESRVAAGGGAHGRFWSGQSQ